MSASRSPSSRRAWIEMTPCCRSPAVRKSPSSRRAWIEIRLPPPRWCSACVALLAEGVDRNKKDELKIYKKKVALLAEGVDRNCEP